MYNRQVSRTDVQSWRKIFRRFWHIIQRTSTFGKSCNIAAILTKLLCKIVPRDIIS